MIWGACNFRENEREVMEWGLQIQLRSLSRTGTGWMSKLDFTVAEDLKNKKRSYKFTMF